VFLLVFLSTLPPALPFIVMRNASSALRTSNGVAIVMLFIAGAAYARVVGWTPWIFGISMVALGSILVLLVPAIAGGQDAPVPADQSANQEQERSTGLPPRVKWTFNFDAGWGTFGFANSLYDNPKEPGVDENLSESVVRGVRPAGAAERLVQDRQRAS
jgi:hypothetical protein